MIHAAYLGPPDSMPAGRLCVRCPGRVRLGLAVMILPLAGLLISGCAARAAAPPPGADPAARLDPFSPTDPCAMQLHDISGALLLYYFNHEALPLSLEDLSGIPGTEQPLALSCPVSRRPYVYVPHGIFIPERGVRVIVHDPLPSHAGMRLAITIEEPQPGMPLVTKVIALPESFFLLSVRDKMVYVEAAP